MSSLYEVKFKQQKLDKNPFLFVQKNFRADLHLWHMAFGLHLYLLFFSNSKFKISTVMHQLAGTLA